MTGAGSATVAWAAEQSYLGGVGGTPTYYQPGKNITIDEASLDNTLQRMRDPDNPESIESVAQNLEGAFGASWVLTDDQFHDLVFNNGTSDGWTSGRMPSAEWYLGVDYLTGTAERVLQGVALTDVTISWTQGDVVTVSVTGVYGDEDKNTSITPSGITKQGDPVAFHSADFTVDSTVQAQLQSATLSFSPLARLRRGSDRTPVDAVLGPVDPVLELQANFTEDDQLELFYGSSGATSPQDTVGGVSASATFNDPAGTAVLDYSLSSCTPSTYGWSDLVNSDTDLTEPITFHVNGVSVV